MTTPSTSTARSMFALTRRAVLLRGAMTPSCAACGGRMLHNSVSVQQATSSSGLATPPCADATPATDAPPEAGAPLYPGHVHLSGVQRAFLGFGAAALAFRNPARGDMVAVLSEACGLSFLPGLRDQMTSTAEGRRLLIEQPSINSQNIDMDYLKSLPAGTFGRTWVDWLNWCHVSPDTRKPIKYVDDLELRYVLQRYRECHDFYHVLIRMPVSQLGETVTKYFEAAHMHLPMAVLASIAGPTRLRGQDLVLFPQLARWAVQMGQQAKPLISVRWEDRWEQPFDEVLKELNITRPPVQLEYTPRRAKKTRKLPFSTRIVEARDKGVWKQPL